MIKLENILSIYIVIVMFVIGIYMAFLQSTYLKTVNDLEKEAKFTKVVGYGYIVLSILACILYLK